MRTKGDPTHGGTTENETTERGLDENGHENDGMRRRLKKRQGIYEMAMNIENGREQGNRLICFIYVGYVERI